jgi:hypothetical protein
MKYTNRKTVLGVMLGTAAACSANAAVINVGNPAPGSQAADLISVSTTWTNNNTYNLVSQIYVTNGATLTIQPGTVIASTPTVDGSGSLAVTRGSMIIANGTVEEPIIFTSTADVATWDPLPGHPTGKDPATGTWRPSANEWGNLTIMGNGRISDSLEPGNSATCNAGNVSSMEGLIADFKGDTKQIYGGGNDNDDSGSIRYVSIRYAGRVIGLGDELNGLSLGGIGRDTDIEHVEIMNNVDDGIEIWGGAVNIKYFNIWNVGDDSFDVDQGWRGKAQFGLVVQGYSLNPGTQGSGVGDNCLEIDGAEQADAQPVTTATLYNLTVIGQPVSGDDGAIYADGARVQIRNSIFMDLGERLIRNRITDGEGSIGYGFNGTMSFMDTWTAPYTVTSTVNPCNNPAAIYQAQSQGNAGIQQGFLNEMTDSVFFRNSANAYNDSAGPPLNEGSNTVSVTIAGGSNPAKANVVAGAGSMPIVALTRGPNVTIGALTMQPVTSIDPRPANAALASNSSAPNDGFFTPASYRGAFAANENWLCLWTATDAYGFNIAPPGGCVLPCPADLDGNSIVNIDDLLAVINAWGQGAGNPADIDNNGIVNIDDLLTVINAWGGC